MGASLSIEKEKPNRHVEMCKKTISRRGQSQDGHESVLLTEAVISRRSVDSRHRESRAQHGRAIDQAGSPQLATSDERWRKIPLEEFADSRKFFLTTRAKRNIFQACRPCWVLLLVMFVSFRRRELHSCQAKRWWPGPMGGAPRLLLAFASLMKGCLLFFPAGMHRSSGRSKES